MASLRASSHVCVGVKGASCSKSFLPVCAPRSRLNVTKASKTDSVELGFEAGKLVALSTVASQWFLTGHAQAAAELSQIAANDSRAGIIATLFLPAIGWVAFNILQPLLNQLGRMDELRGSKGVIGAAALTSALSLLIAENAQAASEVSTVAANDNRLSIILTLFVPAIGWVLFNILQPLFNQLGRMDELRDGGSKKRGIATVVGLGTALSLLAAENADAASELSQLAVSDNRASILLTLFVPAIGWVLFNIFQPLTNQLGRMDEMRRNGVAMTAASGAALSLFCASNADAASELSQLAATDNRASIILTLFIPALGWVAFNILQPLLNQLGRMDELKK